ncbi:MAG: M14 family metallopeptidase [Myxococcota bacterium]
MAWTPYLAESYLDFEDIEAFCRELARAHPEWVELEVAGESRRDRPIFLLTISQRDRAPDGSIRGERPALWLDAGTHASEWTGISAVLFAVSRWVERLEGGDEALRSWFATHEAVVMPCISPDGVQAMADGAPFIRSSLRPPAPGEVRSGLDPCDIDGDDAVRMMRWKHPAGSFVEDPEWAPFMRPRNLDDDPEDAYFLCDEGEFIHWDGVRWMQAPREYGVDLNRNFPAHWAPFSMFGMDAGNYPGSEPESRAVIDAFGEHPHVCCALTMHTYTGCVLTQPYRRDSPLEDDDITMMEALAEDMVADTGYRVFRVCPDFMYDESKPIVGVWADTISSVFGVPGYTVELWDPFGYAGIELDKPTEFFRQPDMEKTRELLLKFAEDEDNFEAWRKHDHPQLGEVEIGGIEYMRTVRNPPPALLADECEKAWTMIERSRRALPEIQAKVSVRSLADGAHQVRVVLENEGFLPTSALQRGAAVGSSPGVSVHIEASAGIELQGPSRQQLDHIEGWGSLRTGAARNPLYAGLPPGGHRQFAEWTVTGRGELRVEWQAGRAGRGHAIVELE